MTDLAALNAAVQADKAAAKSVKAWINAATPLIQPPVPAVGVPEPWFAPTAWPNVLIGVTPSIDPQSAKWISTIVAACPNGLAWDTNEWSTPIYKPTSSTATRTLTASWGGKIQMPYLAGWKPAPDGSDDHLATMLQDGPNRGDYIETQAFVVNADGTLACSSYATGNAITGTGAPVLGNGISGLCTIAGLVTPSSQSLANYGLRVAAPCLSNQYRAPAIGSDGQNPNGPPMGACAYLPANAVLPAGLDVFQKLTTQRLKLYGMRFGDSNSGQALSAKAESTIDGSTYSLPFTALPVSIIAQMHILAA